MLWMVRHVVLGVSCRAVRFWISVDAEHREVARLARPHPVIGVAAELTHALWHGEHQTNVGEILISRSVILVALIERLYLNAERFVDVLHRIAQHIGERVEDMFLLSCALL